MSSAECHFGLLASVVRSAERLCEGKLCYLRYRRRVGVLCLLYRMYHRAGHSLLECLHYLLAARNTRASAALGELALVILRGRTDQFRRLFFPAAVAYGTCCCRHLELF